MFSEAYLVKDEKRPYGSLRWPDSFSNSIGEC
jgi:hypothetical protein